MLADLDEYLTSPPEIETDSIGLRKRVGKEWTAAMLWGPVEPNPRLVGQINDVYAPEVEAAWTEAGALMLAELLPDDYADVRAAIRERFAR
jgi:hypothetical protein